MVLWLTFFLPFFITFAASLHNDLPKVGGEVLLHVEAPWNDTDFKALLIESIAGFNESLYLPALELIYGLGDSEEVDLANDKEVYESVITGLSIEQSGIDFINFNLVYKRFAPRVIAHYNHYEQVLLKQNFNKQLLVHCEKDLFGEIVEKKNGEIPAWVSYNDEIYCSVSDLFALKTIRGGGSNNRNGDSDRDINVSISNDRKGHTLFDRVIGINKGAPLVEFYGDPSAESTQRFLSLLHQEAIAGKLQFVWRYVPLGSPKQRNFLAGYSCELVKLDTIDSEPNSSTLSLQKNFAEIANSSTCVESTAITTTTTTTTTAKKTKSETKTNLDTLNEIGYKLTSFVLFNKYSMANVDVLRTIVNNFPKFLYFLDKFPENYHVRKVKTKAIENENMGLLRDSIGLYINGSPIHHLELDVFKLVEKIQQEQSIVENLVELGFDSKQAKLLIQKFALLSSVKQSQFDSGNTIMGNNDNRFMVFKSLFRKSNALKGGVVFFNNIEKDQNYQDYQDNPYAAYLGPDSQTLKPNQIPPLRENVHDIIFAINLADKQQLKIMFAMSKLILDSGIPQQIGVLPLSGSSMDLDIANRFYHILKVLNPQEVLAFLYKYLDDSDNFEKVFEKVDLEKNFNVNLNTIPEKYSIFKPSVIVNGVIYDLSLPTWQMSMSKQIAQDISSLKANLKQAPSSRGLKNILYNNAKARRNARISQNPRDSLYKLIGDDLLEISHLFKKKELGQMNQIAATMWFVSDFSHEDSLKQFINLLKLIELGASIQVRVLNLGNTSIFKELMKNLQQQQQQQQQQRYGNNVVDFSALTDSSLGQLYDVIRNGQLSTQRNETIVKAVEHMQLPTQHSYMLLNSRYLRMDIVYSVNDLEELLEFEWKQRLNMIEDVVSAYPEAFHNFDLIDFAHEMSKLGHKSINDWFDLLSSVVTKSFHVDDKTFVVDVNRFDFDSVDMSNSIEILPYTEKKTVDVLLIIDPMDESFSQKAINMIAAIESFSFVNIRILLQPGIIGNGGVMGSETLPYKRFYRGIYPSSIPIFGTNGQWLLDTKPSAVYENLPFANYLLKTEYPEKWVVEGNGYFPTNMDPDCFNPSLSNVYFNFKMTGLLVDGYARDIHTGRTPEQLQLELSSDNSKTDTLVMSALNYFQMKAPPGVSQSLSASSDHVLLSASRNKYDSNVAIEELQTFDVPVFDLSGTQLHVRVDDTLSKASLKRKQENDKLQVQNQKRKSKTRFDSNLNIFTTICKKLDEILVGKLIASVRKYNPSADVTFWVLSNYASSTFKAMKLQLETEYNVTIEFVTYKWPNFVRRQLLKQKICQGYKVLFLDVLFPQELENVVYMSPNLICRADLSTLVNLELYNAPYAFPSMCEDKENGDVDMFWKHGYWHEILGKNGLNYHSSEMFVANLTRIRDLGIGNVLRSHYQKLSSDSQSLHILDQDLVNNLQGRIKIETLSNVWGWTDKWCPKSTLQGAKIITYEENESDDERGSKGLVVSQEIPELKAYEKKIKMLYQNAQNIIEISQRLDPKLGGTAGADEEQQAGDFVEEASDGEEGGWDDTDYHDEL